MVSIYLHASHKCDSDTYVSKSNPRLAWEPSSHGGIYGPGPRTKGSNADGPGLATGQGVPPMPATRPCRVSGATHRDPPFSPLSFH
ncbi:hypothetical protein Y032_0001g196 [Ancylostoma ceylanicum]|uniref:Uncharacterized protein n=1 Tax=Ancylostoma ceylanicum TaxID=53326 RepID=A0A016W352_9BILA|nr:hypothetical protein Y032_0001g196 [Ancylostoma ceylanicum]